MKKFFKEFKEFITRGNVLDLAVGVIIGGAFTAIVTALTSNILQPFINWIIYICGGKNGNLDSVYTFLVGSSSDLSNAIYINWGAFISAIINFLLIAFVLFLIVKSFNSIQKSELKLKDKCKENKLTKEDKKELKAQGIKITDIKKVKEYKEKKKVLIAEEKARIEQEEKLKEEQEKIDNPSTEDLLKQIKELLEKK
ncbi:MAG: large conductance mechanosensitive channel protein MscL [Clostridia bacterium]|nr:large conductance mechanosensitive channel protein MscL [Clostridia bacterium]